MRAAVYARYSSDRQSDRSIADQVRLCRERAAALGAEVAAVYDDAAISGAFALNRPGLQALLDAAREGRIDLVIAEALDRLSRDQEDVAGLYKRLSHLGVRLVTLAEGEINELHVGLKGTMNALFLKDLADKTRRGQRGNAEAGLIPGGLSYGYEMVRELDARGDLKRGRRRVIEAEAAIVRRIFAEYAKGRSPRAIARDLNREGVAGPRGGTWAATTIVGNRARGTGILNNELYIGRLVYNRQRFVKDPDTGRRQARLNPRTDWTVVDVPELRIVADSLWAACQDLKGAFAPRSIARRPKRLLSGLLVCASCGGSYIITQGDKVGCANHKERGTCGNGRQASMSDIERRVFDAIKRQLMAPELLAEVLREMQQAFRAQAGEAAKARADRQRRLARIAGEIDRIVDAVARGFDTPAMLGKLRQLERDKMELESAAREDAAGAEILTIHPAAAEMYRRKVEALQDSLRIPTAAPKAAALLREMIDRIVVEPTPQPQKVGLVVEGRMAGLLNLGEDAKAEQRRVVMVAGAGFEPATFRL